MTNTYSYNSPTFTTAFTGRGSGGSDTITAQVSSDCGLVTTRKTITIGAPARPTFSQRDAGDMCYSGTAYYNITNYDPALTYSIQANGATAIRDPGGFRLKKRGSGYVSFTVTVSNGCGTSTTDGEVEFNCDGQRAYAVYPNPAASELTVEQTDSPSPSSAKSPAARSTASPAPSTPFTVYLYDGQGAQQRRQTTTAPALRLGLGTLPAGLYWLRIEAGGKVVESRQLQITH